MVGAKQFCLAKLAFSFGSFVFLFLVYYYIRYWTYHNLWSFIISTNRLRLCFILRSVACLFWRISRQRAPVWGKSKIHFYTAFMGSGHVNLSTLPFFSTVTVQGFVRGSAFALCVYGFCVRIQNLCEMLPHGSGSAFLNTDPATQFTPDPRSSFCRREFTWASLKRIKLPVLNSDSVADPDSLNPDPASQVNPVSDPAPGFGWKVV
jgi:hypothetical protein